MKRIEASNSISIRRVLNDVMSRFFPIISDTSIECVAGATQSIRIKYVTSTAGTLAAIIVPSVSLGFWFIISCQKATAGDTNTIRWSMIRNSRV